MSRTNPESELTTPPHLYTVHDSVPYRIATQIRDHDGLAGDAVATGAPAYHRYSQTPDDEVVAAHPDGYATAVHLASITMTTVSLEAVPDDVLTIVADDVDITSYSLLVFGRPPRTPNHSIHEYASSG